MGGGTFLRLWEGEEVGMTSRKRLGDFATAWPDERTRTRPWLRDPAALSQGQLRVVLPGVSPSLR